MQYDNTCSTEMYRKLSGEIYPRKSSQSSFKVIGHNVYYFCKGCTISCVTHPNKMALKIDILENITLKYFCTVEIFSEKVF